MPDRTWTQALRRIEVNVSVRVMANLSSLQNESPSDTYVAFGHRSHRPPTHDFLSNWTKAVAQAEAPFRPSVIQS